LHDGDDRVVTATCLVILSAVLHAGWNAAVKRQRRPDLAAIVVLGVAAICASAVAPFARVEAFASRAALVWAIVAGVAEAGYFVTLGRALTRAPLGLGYTIARGGSILVVWPASVLWLGERASAPAYAGTALVVIGLAVMGAVQSRAGGGAAGAVARSGVAYAALSALFIATVHLSYKRALAAGAEENALFAVSLVVALPISVLALGRGAIGRLAATLREHPAALTISGVVCTVSFLVFLSALHSGGAGRILTLRNTSVVFAQVFGWILGERPSRAHLMGVGGVVAGAVLLGLG
jgi:uncharacterized membrane protein